MNGLRALIVLRFGAIEDCRLDRASLNFKRGTNDKAQMAQSGQVSMNKPCTWKLAE
jgi:hypothetical protein